MKLLKISLEINSKIQENRMHFFRFSNLNLCCHVHCSEFKVKKNVTFLSNNTITYIEPRTMVFNRSASVGSENDTFITLNVPVYVSIMICDL